MSNSPQLPLPKSWPTRVKSAMLHVISLARFAVISSRGWAAASPNGRVRLKAENKRLLQEVSLLREEIRIKDTRIVSIAPHKRPHYSPTERLGILELRASRGWSLQQTAGTFQLTAQTLASWTRRIDESGPEALLRAREPSTSSLSSFATRYDDSKHSARPWAS